MFLFTGVGAARLQHGHRSDDVHRAHRCVLRRHNARHVHAEISRANAQLLEYPGRDAGRAGAAAGLPAVAHLVYVAEGGGKRVAVRFLVAVLPEQQQSGRRWRGAAVATGGRVAGLACGRWADAVAGDFTLPEQQRRLWWRRDRCVRPTLPLPFTFTVQPANPNQMRCVTCAVAWRFAPYKPLPSSPRRPATSPATYR